MASDSYRHLDAGKTIATLQTLRNRVTERFPSSGLAGVAGELCDLAAETRERVEWIQRPHRLLRFSVLFVLVLFAVAVIFGVQELMNQHVGRLSFADTVALLDGLTNELLVTGAAMIFLLSLEQRAKRTRAMRALHELRAIAHVIDMHQLTKDPGRTINAEKDSTKSSPKRILTPFQLTRYLDYCSEMLSLVGKLAALYAQSLTDPVVVAAVNDIETLTNGFSRKIWQKIVMLDELLKIAESSRKSALSTSAPGFSDAPASADAAEKKTS